MVALESVQLMQTVAVATSAPVYRTPSAFAAIGSASLLPAVHQRRESRLAV